MSHSKMLLIETEEGNGSEFNKLQTPAREPDKGTDYSDDSDEDNEYGIQYSDEEYGRRKRNKKDDLYEDDDPNEYDEYYPDEVDTERNPKTKLSASTCRPRRGIGNDVTLNVTCGDRVSIDCDLPRFGSCISRFVGCKNIEQPMLNSFKDKESCLEL